MKYKFQIEDGYVSEGNTEFQIINHIAEINELTKLMQHLIDTYGGQLVKEEEVKSKPRKGKKEVISDKVTGNEAVDNTRELLHTIEGVADDSTNS